MLKYFLFLVIFTGLQSCENAKVDFNEDIVVNEQQPDDANQIDDSEDVSDDQDEIIPDNNNDRNINENPGEDNADNSGSQGPRTWSETQVLTAADGVYYKATAAAGNYVYSARGDGQINIKVSSDQGSTWGDEIYVTSGFMYLSDPLIAVNNSVYLLYVKDIRSVDDILSSRPVGNIYFRRSDDNGQTWGAEKQLSTSQGAFRMSIEYSAGGILHVSWMDLRSEFSWDIYYARSLDNGENWEVERKIVPYTEQMGGARPSITTQGNDVYITWMDGRDNRFNCPIEGGYILPVCTEVYLISSNDQGGTWSAARRVTDTGVNYAGRPEISVAPNGEVLAISYDSYVPASSGVEQKIIFSYDKGASFTSPFQVSDKVGGDSTHGTLLLTNSNVHLIWFDTYLPSNPEIYYRSFNFTQQQWSDIEAISNNSGQSYTPLLSKSTDYLHAIWQDNTGGTQEIFYKRF